MSKKRFSRLRYALKSLQSPLGGTDNNPVAGSILANYKDFRDGKSVANYPRDATSKPISLITIAVNPFHIVLDADAPAYTTMSKRVSDKQTLAPVITAAGIIPTPPAGTIELNRFTPAKAVIFVPTAPTDTLVTSQITGVKYNPKEGDSYTVPFGQKSGDIYESEVRAKILTAVNALAPTKECSVTFQSEKVG